jgi:hypothetical protein
MRAVRAAILLALTLSMLGYAQAPAPSVAPVSSVAQGANRLPVRRVVLYKSGVGYFEHLGRVRGNQTITIDFTSGQLDDVLKSLTALDLDGGRISGVSYNSEAGLERRLAGLRLPVGEGATRAQFLAALRGARLEIRDGATRVAGRLLSVESTSQRRGDAVVSTDTLSIVTDAGSLQTIALEPRVAVRILDADLNQEVAKYLALIGSVRDQDVRRMTLSATGAGDRDLFVSYVSEVPVWKATYRLVMPGAKDNRPPLLQGWAIVDNTVGEDWNNVQLSLVAGAPQSFIQAVSRPYYVQRPIVPLPDRVLLSPQTHQGALALQGNGALTGVLRDPSGGLVPGATVAAVRSGQRATAVTDRNGQFRIENLPPGPYEITFSLTGFRTATYRVDIAAGMESVLNGVIALGAINESITARSARNSTTFGLPQSTLNMTIDGVSGAGSGAGDGFFASKARADAIEEVSLTTAAAGANAAGGGAVEIRMAAAGADAVAEQLGDLFEYRLKEPITIRKNQSAMVPILNAPVEAQKVSVWAPSAGNRALRAIWLTNTSGNTLDAGTFSIQEDQAFAGEGLIEPLKAGERRLLSYAVDLALILSARSEPVPTRTTETRVTRGLLVQKVEERQRRVYSARNEDAEPRTLVIEHPVRPGWTLGGAMKPVETTAASHRFSLTIAPRTTATFDVEETRSVDSQIALASLTDDQLALFVRNKAISAELETQLQEIQRRKAGIARLSAALSRLEGEAGVIANDQQRVRDNMQALRGSAEERQLVQRYVKQLNEQEDRLAAIRREIAALQAQRQNEQLELTDLMRKMGQD